MAIWMNACYGTFGAGIEERRFLGFVLSRQCLLKGGYLDQDSFGLGLTKKAFLMGFDGFGCPRVAVYLWNRVF